MEKRRPKSPKLSDRKLKQGILTPDNKESEKKNNETIQCLINSIFKNNLKKEELIKKHRPFFSLKVIPNQDIEKVYSSLEKIPMEKIDLVEEFKYEEERFESKNLFETNSKSFGLSSFDVDLSVNIFGNKQKATYNQNKNNLEISSKNSSKIYCIHTIFISLFRTVIDFKDIKLAKQVFEELKEIENANVLDKKKLLEKFVDKFGLYIPLELVIGGRMNISFEANNDEEKNLYHNKIQKALNADLGVGFGFFSAKIDVNYKDNKGKDNLSQLLNSVQNMSTKIIGGDYLFRDDLKNWVKSFNIDNLQVIEYKNLIPIYCFIPGFENKLKICLKSHDDIALQQIYDLIGKEFKKIEENLLEGSSTNDNSWNVGITKEEFNSYIIWKKRFLKRIIITKNKNTLEKYTKINTQENNNNKNEQINVIFDCDQLYLCGIIPDGCIICGWDISTDVNSLPYNVVCSWKRKKEIKIIGSRCFKFKLDINLSEIKNYNKDFEIEWLLNIFYINSNYLMPQNFYQINNMDYSLNKEIIIFFQDEYKIKNILKSENESFNFVSADILKKKKEKEIPLNEINQNFNFNVNNYLNNINNLYDNNSKNNNNNQQYISNNNYQQYTYNNNNNGNFYPKTLNESNSCKNMKVKQNFFGGKEKQKKY